MNFDKVYEHALSANAEVLGGRLATLKIDKGEWHSSSPHDDTGEHDHYYSRRMPRVRGTATRPAALSTIFDARTSMTPFMDAPLGCCCGMP